MSDGRPLFAFAFRGGLAQPLRDLAEADVAASNADFVWVHLDLRDAAAQAWLRGRPWPPDVVEAVAPPFPRGRLFITPDLGSGPLPGLPRGAPPLPRAAGAFPRRRIRQFQPPDPSLRSTSRGCAGVRGAMSVPARRAAGAGRGADQPKHLYTHDVLGDIPAGNADRGRLGHERCRHSVQRHAERFLGGRRPDSGGLLHGSVWFFPASVVLWGGNVDAQVDFSFCAGESCHEFGGGLG